MSTVLDAAATTLAELGSCRLCCALSGGVDSVVLLDVLDQLQSRFGYTLEAAHVHHGLNAAADDWQNFCAALCQRRGIAFRAFRVEIDHDHPGGMEEAARMARHAALARVDCDWLALGHHRDDQAETVLFRLLRGAGVQGAAAMASIQPVKGRAGLLRPLLNVGREDILAFARERQLEWVDDSSNADPRFTRNDLRHRILPAVEVRFPAARQTLARAAAHFRQAAELLDELAEIDSAACRTKEGDAFVRQRLLNLSPARLTNLFRHELRLLGALSPPTAQLAEALRQLRATPAPLCLPLGKCSCHSRRGKVWLSAIEQAQTPDC